MVASPIGRLNQLPPDLSRETATKGGGFWRFGHAESVLSLRPKFTPRIAPHEHDCAAATSPRFSPREPSRFNAVVRAARGGVSVWHSVAVCSAGCRSFVR